MFGRLWEALRGNVGATRQSGHNVIFASIAAAGAIGEQGMRDLVAYLRGQAAVVVGGGK